MKGEIEMTDLYTKIVLTVIAAALSVNVLISLEFVGPAHAASGVQKVVICDEHWASGCAGIINGRLKVSDF